MVQDGKYSYSELIGFDILDLTSHFIHALSSFFFLNSDFVQFALYCNFQK